MGGFHGNQHTKNEYENYSYDELVADIQSLAVEIDTVPTTRDAAEDDALPCLARIYDIIPGNWQDVLDDADAGATQVERYRQEERPEMIRDLRRVGNESNGDALTTRDYDENGSYPTSVLKEFFGSWDEACAAADIERGTKHGTQCTGPRGEQLDSKLELAIAEALNENDIDYFVHPRIQETDWISDFRLPAIDLWIEVDGYGNDDRPNTTSFEEKLTYYEEHEMAFEIISSVGGLERCLGKRDMLPP